MQVFRNRARRDHHDHHTTVTTNGARIITTSNGHGHAVAVPATHVSSRHDRGHRGTTNVVAANVARGHGHGRRGTTTVVTANVPHGHGHGTHVTTSRDQRRYYGDEPSTIHGLWNKLLGTLTGNRRRRRHGDREMRKAHERREALRIGRGGQRVRATGNMSKLHKFRERRRHRRRDHKKPIVIAADDGRSQSRTPWLHHKHRTLPPYHGMHHKILGFLTGGRDRRALGKAMAAAAEKDRRRERIRRRKEMKETGRRYRERGTWF